MFTAPLYAGGGDDSVRSNVPNRSRGEGSHSSGHGGDVEKTGHGNCSLSNVMACENGVENGDCCGCVSIDKTCRDPILNPDSGNNNADNGRSSGNFNEVVGGGDEIVCDQFPRGYLRAGHCKMDWCQLEADERQPKQNQRGMSRQGQSLLRLGRCWEGQY